MTLATDRPITAVIVLKSFLPSSGARGALAWNFLRNGSTTLARLMKTSHLASIKGSFKKPCKVTYAFVFSGLAVLKYFFTCGQT